MTSRRSSYRNQFHDCGSFSAVGCFRLSRNSADGRALGSHRRGPASQGGLTGPREQEAGCHMYFRVGATIPADENQSLAAVSDGKNDRLALSTF